MYQIKSTLFEKTLIVMSTLLAILYIILPVTVFLWLWHKWCDGFAWLCQFDEQIAYEPLDTDEGKTIDNPYEIDKEDRISFQWDEDTFGLN